MISRSVAAACFGILLGAAAPSSLAAPLRLKLVDDRGIRIDDPIKVCFNRGLETSCLEQAPYEVPFSSQDFDSLTAEGPRHGPIQIERSRLKNNQGNLSVSVPRKASLTINGLPTAPISVSLYPGDDPTFRKPAFRFENVTSSELWIPARRFVLALSDGRNAPVLKVLTIKPGGKYAEFYRAQVGWSLLVRGLAEDNSPVRGASASLVSATAGGQDHELMSTTTESDGLGVFNGITGPYVTLASTASGYLKTLTPGITSKRGAFAFQEFTLERGGNVRAVVTIDGQPAGGAHCQIVSTERKRTPEPRLASAVVLAETIAAPGGVCETARFTRGQYLFRVIPADANNSNDEFVTLFENQTLSLDVKLNRYPVSGTVKRAMKPVAGVYVVVNDEADFSEYGRTAPPEPLKLETNDDGHYRGDVWRRGTYLFAVASKAMVCGASKDAEVTTEGAVVDFELNGGDVKGIVVDQDEKPIADAFVTLTKFLPDGSENRVAWSDDSGGFGFPFDGSGLIQLLAEKSGYEKADPVNLEVVADADLPPQTIVLKRLDRIEGHVVWSGGGGAPGIGVATFQTGSGVPINAGSALTEADGHFSVAKSNGASTRVFVTGAGCPLQVSDVPNTGEEVTLPCASESSGLQITMKKQDGAPVQGERVILRWNGVLIPNAVLAEHLNFLGLPNGTGVDGKLTVVALPPGNYDVFLQSGSSEATISQGQQYGFIATVTLAPMETAELEVKVQ